MTRSEKTETLNWARMGSGRSRTHAVSRARRHLGAGETDAAIAELLDAEPRTPEKAEVHYLLGEAYLLAGKNRAAVKAYRRSFELDPSYAAKDTSLLRRFVPLLAFGEMEEEVSSLMAQAGDPAVPVLTEAVGSRNHHLRWNAVQTLERMQMRPDYVRAYILDLQNEDCIGRKRAAERLGELGDRRAIPILVEAKKRPLFENYCMFWTLDQALERLGAR